MADGMVMNEIDTERRSGNPIHDFAREMMFYKLQEHHEADHH